MGQAKSNFEDLTKCGICEETITDPRALPCLHTYCLDCLREWVKRNTDTVTCPSCKKVVTLPGEGVDGLPGNFYVSSLLEKSPPKGSKKCICCGEDAAELIARCLECNGFLCQKGLDAHKTLLMMKSHQVVSINDLKSGKVDVRNLLKPPKCNEHKEQTLWLFCETCGVIICRDCTVLNHCSPDHKYMELDSVVDGQKDRIVQLDKDCDTVVKQINDEMERMATTKRSLEVALTKASLEIDKTTEAFKQHIDKICKEEQEKLQNWGKQSSDDIGKRKEKLEGQNERLKIAQTMAKQVISSGSNYDVASMYTQLTTSLEDLSQQKPEEHNKDYYRVRFEAETMFSDRKPALGTLKFGPAD